MKIGAEFHAKDWPALRAGLEAGEAKTWERAVELLNARVGGRYLRHARSLLSQPYSGFAVLAIDCAVVEALEQFRRGTAATPWKKGREYFRSFLTETRFGEHFTEAQADVFYTSIRCGILHQAETGDESLVKKKAATWVVKDPLEGDGLIINVRAFHQELEAALEDYAAKLLAGDSVFRAAFIVKMNHVARAPVAMASVA